MRFDIFLTVLNGRSSAQKSQICLPSATASVSSDSAQFGAEGEHLLMRECYEIEVTGMMRIEVMR